MSINKICDEYPHSILPEHLNKRTGKAKNCLFEQINMELYEESAKILTYHTSLERIHFWIKTLHLFYYEYLGGLDTFDVKWKDDPQDWTDRNYNGNSIIIELWEDERMQFNITFFVTTGTVRVQGIKYKVFNDDHFPVLKETLQKVIIHNQSTDENDNEIHVPQEENSETVHETNLKVIENESAQENDSTSKNSPGISEEKTETCSKTTHITYDSTKLTTMSDKHYEELLQHICRLETSVADGIDRIDIHQSESMKDINSSIVNLELSMKKQVSQQKTQDMEPKQKETFDKQIQVLKQKNEDLETEIRNLKRDSYLEKVELESRLECTEKALQQTSGQLKTSVEMANSESLMYENKLADKNREIEALNDSTARMRAQLGAAQDEIISLKTHIGNITTDNRGMSAENSNVNHKPIVCLIGTSNVAKLQESKLSNDCIVRKYVKFTMIETKQFLESDEIVEVPNLAILHSLTNDIKKFPPEKCRDDMNELVILIKDKWPSAKIIISLTTPRSDSITNQTNAQIVNALIKELIAKEKTTQISCCDHSSMLVNGSPSDDLLEDDKYHLSPKGLSYLAFNLKTAMYSALNMTMPTPQRGRSRSRGPGARGRGRGRKYFK